MQSTSTMSRRTFAATAALAAAGVSASVMSSKAFADAASTVIPENWDYEADIVAIGAGGAGLAGGVEARALGLSYIIVESTGIVGGNSALCNGGMALPGSPLQAELGIEDSPDQMFEDLCAWFGTDYDEGYVRMLCDLNGGDLYDWLTGLGIEFDKSGLLQSNGHSRPREHHVGPYEVIRVLDEKAQADGVEIHFETTATRIIRNPETGRVLGIKAVDADGNELYYKAKKALLLCSGGYGRNTEMLAEWNFGPAAREMTDFNGSVGQMGQGLIMAMAIGAQPRHLSYCGMLTVLNPDGGHAAECAMYHQGAILVNLQGQRFVNEAQGYTNVWSELLQQPENMCFQVWDDAIAAPCEENESGYYSMAKIRESGYLLEADTLDELADLMGFDAEAKEAFLASVEKYNADIDAEGKDTLFNREHISGTGAAPVKIETAPFYGFKTTSIVSSTYGGLKRWSGDMLQAEDVFGDVIEGLYLAGNISDFCNMGIVPGTRRPINASGCSFGGALSFGRKCVQEMAKLEDWDA
ncbi:MAG: FAD-binding protein [Coriobacteriia bacterium]|nr:FAD-binding protein [Coriobacteriia bacterium]MBS5477086.1 FAD-binding protein [Coriobacteriia bacterium]